MDILLLICILGVAAANEGLAPVIREQPSSVVARRNEPATLNCAASGAARITWFRDGQPVITSSQDTHSHRVLLPSGSLFFLRVVSSRRDSDAGSYWCVASNSYGATRSQNASLTIASLSYEFESYPEPVVKARIGDSVILPCRAPKGTPEPELQWLRDGQEFANSSRITVSSEGDLVINNVGMEDSATYVCRAHNVAGSRETRPTELIIMIPPWFEMKPANVTTASGVLVELICRAQGSPMPTVTWRRLDGIMPLGRATIEDQRLVLEQVTAVDSGMYVCEVQNEAGVATAKATLTVVDAPELMHRPQDIQVMAGKAAELSCIVEGDPSPLLLWRLPTQDRTALLTPSQKSGHASISQDGQILQLDITTTQDSGIYYCWGISGGGGVSAQAEVMVVEAYPPPVIGVGPKDLILIPGSIATFSCEVVSEAATPSISWWYRPAAHLPARQLAQGIDDRVSLSATGALIVKDIRVDDAGIYTCKVSAETGNVEQEAILRVTKEAAETPTASIPAPPSKPQVMFINETTVFLKWLPNSQINTNTKHWYTVEYWRQGWDEWRVADSIIMDEACIVKKLMPGNIYTFLVRAVTRGGTSFPSPWSDPVTIRSPRDPSLTMDQVRHARRRLSRPTVTLTDATATGSSNVLLNWKFLTTAHETVEGVLVYTVAEDGIVKVATVLGSSSSSHHLHNLEPNTYYTFFIVPFWRSVEGTPSNSYSLTTPEDTPVMSPSDINAMLREDNSIHITWSTLSAKEARGKVIGYQVTLTHNGTETTEAVSSPWLEAHGLAPGRLYTVRVAAETEAGLGPFSSPVLIDFGSSNAQGHQDISDESIGDTSVIYAPPQPDWLVYLLVPLVILLFVATILYIRRLHHKSPTSNPPQTPAHYQDPSIYPAHHSINMYSEQKLWRPAECEKEYGLSSVGLLNSDQQINEYAEPRSQHANDTTEPYATTTLLAPASPRLGHGSPWHHQRENSGVQVNWAAFLPPPPACPPPRDLDLGDPTCQATPNGSRQGYMASTQYGNIGGSEQYKRPCDATSEHTYDTYTQVAPSNCGDRFITFNTVHSSDTSRGSSSDDQQMQPTNIPYNNTH